MDDRELLRKNYEDACNAYLRAFCQKHGYDEDDAVNSWAAGDVGGIASVGDEFRIADVCFETDSAADGYQFVSVTGYGLIHYTRNTSGGEFSREFDSLGQCWLEVHTYAEEGYEIINDFNINKLRKYFK